MTAGKTMCERVVGRPRGRKHVETRRRTRRLAPGAIGLCFVMVFAAVAFVVVPSSVRADPLKICQQCPNAPPGQCEPNCGGGGGGGGGIWIPPYTTGTAWKSTGCDSYTLCGSNYIHGNTATRQTGFVSDAVESTAGILEGATADGWVEFTQYIGHPSSTGTWTLDFAWDISWSVWAVAACYPEGGGSYAAASVVIGANAQNENGYFVHNGDVTVTLLSTSTSCPGVPIGSGGSGGVAEQYQT